ncbi:DUF6059 family protein [Streptomyces sp. NBC_01618]|uniref:DUF6059 family protein n=1 Tax=Streptomyces sp. NBC_01618 TaxID=2975900 RepID=UPI0038671551
MRRLLRLCADSLIAYGQIYLSEPHPYIAEPPPPGHPECLASDRPLTETERALDRQLEGRTGRG